MHIKKTHPKSHIIYTSQNTSEHRALLSPFPRWSVGEKSFHGFRGDEDIVILQSVRTSNKSDAIWVHEIVAADDYNDEIHSDTTNITINNEGMKQTDMTVSELLKMMSRPVVIHKAAENDDADEF